jgi:3-deoxy-D-manno-octulosonate 8-phosphate phosphatase (KDO 8-P phosphatase)
MVEINTSLKNTGFNSSPINEVNALLDSENNDLFAWYENGTGDLLDKAQQIKILLTDCDGVLTDNSVYYSARGEELKRFSIRDGMGVERLRTMAHVGVGIVTGERYSPPLQRRAEKLGITELYFDSRQKGAILDGIMERLDLQPQQVAYIGDDTNDLAAIQLVGLSACPADALPMVRDVVDYVCQCQGGYGAFREFAEMIIAAKLALPYNLGG